LDSESDLEGLSRSGYELVLMDSCFVIDFIEYMFALTDYRFIKRSQTLPVICDFIKRELQRVNAVKVGFAPWRRLNKLLKNDSSLLIYLKTDFGKGEGFTHVLKMLEGDYLDVFKRIYAGNKRKSNKRDQYLYVAAAYLNQFGVNTSVATIDKALLEVLRFSRITAYPRPWFRKVIKAVKSKSKQPQAEVEVGGHEV